VPWLNCGTAASCFPLDHLPPLRRRQIGQHWLFPVACCGPWQVQPVGALYELGVFFHATLSLHVAVTDLSNDCGCYVYAHRYHVCNMRDVLNCNLFNVAAILASAGLSIDFTAHISSSFVVLKGTPEKRLAQVMRETYLQSFKEVYPQFSVYCPCFGILSLLYDSTCVSLSSS